MCGIGGIWNRDGRPVESERLHLLHQVLAHRGPDGEAVTNAGEIGFTFRRLSILDLQDRASQPFCSADGEISLLFNGEIHNYLELRERLESTGHRFRTTGDTEVVLQSYLEWGLDCFSRFNGMWAIGLWDRRRRELTLSRDRFGIKPLVYSIRGDRVVFASEAKGVLAAFPEERQVNHQELGIYLVGGSPGQGSPQTFFSNILSVPSGTFLRIRADQEPVPVRYWQINPELCTSCTAPEEEFRELLTDAVRIRLRSDASIGACLSGGVDSSSVVRLAMGFRREPLECFSLRYEDLPQMDESHYASAVADDPERYRIHWTRPRSAEMLADMHRIIWHSDGPTPIRGRLGMWSVYREAARHVKVVLVGEGSDELLAGYSRFAAPYILDCLQGSNGWKLKRLSGLLNGLGLISDLSTNKLQAVRMLGTALTKRVSLTGIPGMTHWISSDFRRSLEPLPPSRFFHTWLRNDVERPFPSHLNNALWHDFWHAGLPEVIHQGDCLSMAFSLENRPPFLDHRLVEFCFSLDVHEKIRDGWTKSILRRAMQGIVPETVLTRRSKMGVPTPFLPFLRDNIVELQDLVLGGKLIAEGILSKRGTELAFRRVKSMGSLVGSGPVHGLWACASSEIWYRQFISGFGVLED